MGGSGLARLARAAACANNSPWPVPVPPDAATTRPSLPGSCPTTPSRSRKAVWLSVAVRATSCTRPKLDRPPGTAGRAAGRQPDESAPDRPARVEPLCGLKSPFRPFPAVLPGLARPPLRPRASTRRSACPSALLPRYLSLATRRCIAGRPAKEGGSCSWASTSSITTVFRLDRSWHVAAE
eukprot:scaffold3143_cov104-Isochrysis_galbana.AAC.10